MSFWFHRLDKNTNEIISGFLPWVFFCSFLGASWKLFGLPGDLVCNIINKEACRKPQKASRKPPGRYKKFQGRNSEIISLVILSKRWNQRDILKLTDLYQVSRKVFRKSWNSNMYQIIWSYDVFWLFHAWII